jgi:hypothetical protein
VSASVWKAECGPWDAPKAEWTKLSSDERAELREAGVAVPTKPRHVQEALL